MKYLIVLCTWLIISESAKLPSTFKKCNRKDPDWKKCVFDAGVDGLSQLTKPFHEVNLPNLEPFLIPHITLAAGSKTVKLTQELKNCKFYGLTKAKPDHFEFDFDRKIIIMRGYFPEVRIVADYKFDGKVLLLPIMGEGPSVTTLKTLHVNGTLHFEEVKKKGKTYIKATSMDIKLTPELIHFHFENLFNGDKTLGDNVNKVLNDNWKEVYADVEDGYTGIVKEIYLSLMNSFFTKVSIEEAFD